VTRVQSRHRDRRAFAAASCTSARALEGTVAPESLTYLLVTIVVVGIAVGVTLVVLLADRVTDARLVESSGTARRKASPGSKVVPERTPGPTADERSVATAPVIVRAKDAVSSLVQSVTAANGVGEPLPSTGGQSTEWPGSTRVPTLSRSASWGLDAAGAASTRPSEAALDAPGAESIETVEPEPVGVAGLVVDEAGLASAKPVVTGASAEPGSGAPFSVEPEPVVTDAAPEPAAATDRAADSELGSAPAVAPVERGAIPEPLAPAFAANQPEVFDTVPDLSAATSDIESPASPTSLAPRLVAPTPVAYGQASVADRRSADEADGVLPPRTQAAPEPPCPLPLHALPDVPARPLDGPIGNPYVDPLTGLDTLLAWERVLAEEGVRLTRYRRPVSVASIELDGMVPMMKQYGPEPARRIIPAVADMVARTARRTDRVAHIGAGRFMVLLPETDEIQAINFLERVRSNCEEWLESTDLDLRIVIGWASATAAGELEGARRTAEERMRAERDEYDSRD
jgi:diguanylate cyclase (GGDEF)-like protein